MSVLSSLRIALCCSLSLTIPLCASAATQTDSPATVTAHPIGEAPTPSDLNAGTPSEDPNRPLTIAVIMPGDNAPTMAANKIVLNGLTAAAINKPNLRLLMIESGSNDNLSNQLKAAVLAGADVAIGPLSHDRVDALLRLPYLPLPVIALNTPTNDMPAETDSQLLLMSISTELEANYVADQAATALEQLNDPDAKVVILRDAAKADYRITAGYEEALQNRHVPYQIMPIDLSGINSQRQLLGGNDQARLPYPIALMSLDAAQAGLVVNRLPRKTQVWGISLLNPGDPETNPTASSLVYDMNNAIFVDSPLLVKYDAQSFEAKFQTPMPYSPTAKRLFALGVDALGAAEKWAHQQMTFKISGESGTWISDRAQSPVVERKPATVLIQDGSLQLLTLDPTAKP